MAAPIDLLRIDGERLDARVESNLAGGELLRTMDGASTLTLEIHDPEHQLLETGLLTRKRSRGDTFGDAAWTRLGRVQATLDGTFWRIAGVTKTGSMLTLTFEDEIVALLRQHTRAVRSSRSDITRAQFVSRLVRSVKERKIISYIPAIDERQRIKKPEAEQTQVGRGRISVGTNLKIKSIRADRNQVRNLNTILEEAASQNANERVTIAMLCAAISESGVREIPNSAGSGYAGVFQADPDNIPMTDTRKQAEFFLKGGLGFQGGGAIALARQHPTWSAGRIVLTVEGSVSNFVSVAAGVKFYETYMDEAEAILAEYGGAGGTEVRRERYVYRAGSHGKGADREREDYWQATERLAEEVNWRAFTANNVFFYSADKDLIGRTAAMTIAEQPSKKQEDRGVQYVGNVDFDWHYNKPVGEVTFSIAADRWLAYAGSVTDLRGLGPAEGRWLNWQFRQGLDSSEMDITLRRPAPDKPEPSTTVTRTPRTTDDTGAELLRWARTQLGTTEGSAKQIRYASALGLSASLPWCSIFVAYGLKQVARGITLPSNPAYSGAWLGWSGGTRINKNSIEPGDLVIFDWGDGGITDHVAIFAGNDQVIGGNQGNKVSSIPLNRPAIVGVVRVRDE